MSQQSAQHLLYLAYGSNMCSARLTARVPSAAFHSIGKLKGYQLAFNKVGTDGSAKANIIATGSAEDIVEGVIFSISPKQLAALDKAEDLDHGYCRKNIEISSSRAGSLSVFTYFALLVDDDILPFDWYKQFCLSGAKEHGLSAEYISRVNSLASRIDDNLERRNINRGILENIYENTR